MTCGSENILTSVEWTVKRWVFFFCAGEKKRWFSSLIILIRSGVLNYRLCVSVELGKAQLQSLTEEILVRLLL